MRPHNLKSSGVAIANFDYSYDAAGNRVGVLEASGDRVTWVYDDANQLLAERRSGGSAYSNTFTYDSGGNRTLLKTDGARTTFTYDVANQLNFSQVSAGRTSYVYDAAGNQQLEWQPSGARTTTIWDYENQPLVYDLSTFRITMLYNPDQRRVFKQGSPSVGLVLYDWDPILDLNCFQYRFESPINGAYYLSEPVRYGRTLGEYRTNGAGVGKNFFHTDALGSVRAITDNSQSILNSYTYGAWGDAVMTSETMSNEFRWVGAYGYCYDGDIVGRYYIRARVYQPTIARWTSVDPLFYMLARSGIIGLGSKVPIGVNGSSQLYEYVDNKPVEMIDPSGMVFLDVPATPSKCAWALFYMKYYALVRALGTYDNILLNHYLGSSGEDLLLPMGAFDHWGGARRTLLWKILDEVDKLRKDIPCNSSRSGDGEIPGQQFTSLTKMINVYTMSANYTWDFSKKCDGCKCSSFKGKLWMTFEAIDRTDFNPGDVFGAGLGAWGIYITDSLVLACNMGKPFDIRAVSTSDWVISGCERGITIPLL